MSDIPDWSSMYPIKDEVHALTAEDFPHVHADFVAILKRVRDTCLKWMADVGAPPGDSGMGFLVPEVHQKLSKRIYPQGGAIRVEMFAKDIRPKGFRAFFRLSQGGKEFGFAYTDLVHVNLDANTPEVMPGTIVTLGGRVRPA